MMRDAAKARQRKLEIDRDAREGGTNHGFFAHIVTPQLRFPVNEQLELVKRELFLLARLDGHVAGHLVQPDNLDIAARVLTHLTKRDRAHVDTE
eukprot:6204545-Pleurochrysis_carterae.AAC.1